MCLRAFVCCMCIQDVFKPVHREHGQSREFEGEGGVGLFVCAGYVCVCVHGGGGGWVMLLCLSGGVCVCLGGGAVCGSRNSVLGWSRSGRGEGRMYREQCFTLRLK